jgi:hypothetical protein
MANKREIQRAWKRFGAGLDFEKCRRWEGPWSGMFEVVGLNVDWSNATAEYRVMNSGIEVGTVPAPRETAWLQRLKEKVAA